MLKALVGISTTLLGITLSTPVLATWQYMGNGSSGEEVHLDLDSITSDYRFRYDIGNSPVDAVADCQNNQWYADGFGWFSPQSKATQDMVSYVCGSAAQSQGGRYCDSYQMGSTWEALCDPNSTALIDLINQFNELSQ